MLTWLIALTLVGAVGSAAGQPVVLSGAAGPAADQAVSGRPGLAPTGKVATRSRR